MTTNDAILAGAPATLSRNEAIAAIRSGLKRRSGKQWSVTGGRGTAWGWISITAPLARKDQFGFINDADRAELSMLLGRMNVHQQGVKVPASSAYYREYVDRAEGRTPTEFGSRYWD